MKTKKIFSSSKASVFKVEDQEILLVIHKVFNVDHLEFKSSDEVFDELNNSGGIFFFDKVNINSFNFDLIINITNDNIIISWYRDLKVKFSIEVESKQQLSFNTPYSNDTGGFNLGLGNNNSDSSELVTNNHNLSLLIKNTHIEDFDENYYDLDYFNVDLSKSSSNILLKTKNSINDNPFGFKIYVKRSKESANYLKSSLFDKDVEYLIKLNPLSSKHKVFPYATSELELKFKSNQLNNIKTSKADFFHFAWTKYNNNNKYTYLPVGKLEIINLKSKENQLLLNSGTESIEIENGDFIEFGIEDTNISYPSTQIKIVPNPLKENKKRAYKSMAQGKVPYKENGESIIPILAEDVANKWFRILPELNEDNFPFEEEILVKERSDRFQKNNNASIRNTSKSSTGNEIVTTNTYGSELTFDNGKLSKYTFCNKRTSRTDNTELETETTLEIDFSGTNIDEKWFRLAEALNKGEVLLVFPAKHYASQESDKERITSKFQFDDWNFNLFKSNNNSSKQLNEIGPLFITNYSNHSFREAFSNTEGTKLWTNQFLFDENQENRNDWQKKGYNLILEENFLESLPQDHQEIFNKPTWKGVTALDIPIGNDDVPEIIRPFVKNINLKAKYLAFGSSLPSEEKKCYAYINFNGTENQTYEGNNLFEYRLNNLTTIISGSEIAVMECEIELKIKSVLGEGTNENIILIQGSYNKDSKTYSFGVKGNGNNTISFNDSVISSVTFSSASASLSSKGENNETETNVNLYFSGSLKFNIDKILELVKNLYSDAGDWNPFPKEIQFFDLGFNISKFIPDLSIFRFDFGNIIPDNNNKNLLDSFPLKYNSFYYENAHELGLIPIGNVHNHNNEGYFKNSIGILFDLELGSLGALSSLNTLKSQLFVGWHKDEETHFIEMGFRINGFSTSVDFSIQDVIKIKIGKLALGQFQTPDSEKENLLYLQLLECEFGVLGHYVDGLDGSIFYNPATKETAWMLYKEQTSLPGFNLNKLVLGQKTGIPKSESPENIEQTFKALEDGISATPPSVYRPDIETIVAADLKFANLFDVKFVFMDPKLYALNLNIKELAEFEILYHKIKENLGVWHGKFAIDEKYRHLEFKAFSVTLPNVKIDWFTNGGFKFDLGFPVLRAYTWDYSNSAVGQLGPFLGKAGVFIGKVLDVIPLCNNLPSLQFGNALRVGIGREFRKGPISAGAHITLYGIFKGTGCFKEEELLPTSFKIIGRAGIILEVYGKANFRIVKVDVRAVLEIYALIDLTVDNGRLQPIKVEAGGRLYVKAKIRIKAGFIKVTKRFKYKTKIKYTFWIGERGNKKSLPPYLKSVYKEIKSITPITLYFTYIPRFTIYNVSTNTEPDTNLIRLYHTIGLLTPNIADPSKTEIEESKELVIDNNKNLRTINEPLIDIITVFIELEKNNQNQLDENGELNKDFDFIAQEVFNFELVAVKKDFENNNEKLSFLPIPLIPNLSINTEDDKIVGVRNDNDYLESVEQQFDNYFIQFEERNKNDNEQLLIEDSNKLTKELLNDFFRFIYKQAKGINEDLQKFLVLDINVAEKPSPLQLRYELETLIQSFFATGIRISNPNDSDATKTTVPLLEAFQNAYLNCGLEEIGDIILKYNGVSIDGKEIWRDDVKNLIQSSNRIELINSAKNIYDKKRDLILKIKNVNNYKLTNIELVLDAYKYDTKQLFFFPDSLKLQKLNSFTVSPKSLDTSDNQDSNRYISIDDVDKKQINQKAVSYALASILKFDVKRKDELYELLSTNSEVAFILRELNNSIDQRDNLELSVLGVKEIYEQGEEILDVTNKKLTIYRNNLSTITNPTADNSKLITKQEDRFDHVASFNEHRNQFLKLLEYASLTNDGGYYINIKEDKSNNTEIRSEKGKLVALELIFSFKENQSKRTYNNAVFISASAEIENNYYYIIKDIETEKGILKDYIAQSKPNILDVRLDENLSELNSIDENAINLILEDYQFLEVGVRLEDGNPILSNDQVISILPQNTGDVYSNSSTFWETSIPLNKLSLNKNKNRYQYIGKTLTLTCNWRNSLGDRFFKDPIDQKLNPIKYIDELVSISEWPDFGYKLEWNDNADKLYFKYEFKPQSKDFSNNNQSKEEVIAHFIGGKDDEGKFNGILETLYLIKDQLDDICGDESNGGSFEIALRTYSEIYLNESRKDKTLLNQEGFGKIILNHLTEYIKNIEDFINTNSDQDKFEGTIINKKIEISIDLVNNSFKKLLTELTESSGNNKSFLPFDFVIKLTRNKDLIGTEFTLLKDTNTQIKKSYSDIDKIKTFKDIAEVISVLVFPLEKITGGKIEKIGNHHLGSGFESISSSIKNWIIKEEVFNNLTNIPQETENNNKIDYLIKPISTHPLSGIYELQQEKFSFDDIDINIALRSVLSAYQRYTKPEYFKSYNSLRQLNILLVQKQEIAKYLASNYIYSNNSIDIPQSINKERIVNSFTDYLLNDLDNFYNTIAINRHKIKEESEKFDSFRLYVSNQKTAENDLILIDTSRKLDNDGIVSFIKENKIQNKSETSNTSRSNTSKRKMFYTYIEHNIQEHKHNEIVKSNWIKLNQEKKVEFKYEYNKVIRELPPNPIPGITMFDYDSKIPLENQDLERFENWNYSALFNINKKDLKKGDEIVITLTDLSNNNSYLNTKKIEFIKTEKELDLNAIAYLDNFIKNSKSPSQIIEKLAKTPIISTKNNVKNLLRNNENYSERIVFSYKEECENASCLLSGEIYIEQDGKIFQLIGDKSNTFLEINENSNDIKFSYKKLKLNDSLKSIKATIEIIRNKKFGKGFEMKTEVKNFQNIVTPNLNYISLKNGAKASEAATVRIVTKDFARNLIRREYVQSEYNKITLEERKHTISGLKHIFASESKLYTSNNFNLLQLDNDFFKIGYYYKLEVFKKDINGFKEYFKVDFLIENS